VKGDLICHAGQGDYKKITSVVDEWCGCRHLSGMLPKFFFVHFRATNCMALFDGDIVPFFIGVLSQAYSDQPYVHFIGVYAAIRGVGLGAASMTISFPKPARFTVTLRNA
jgi:hypothetical protein